MFSYTEKYLTSRGRTELLQIQTGVVVWGEQVRSDILWLIPESLDCDVTEGHGSFGQCIGKKQDLPFIPKRCPISALYLTLDRTRCSLLCNIFPCLFIGVCTRMLGLPRYLWPAFLQVFSAFCFDSRQTLHVAAFRLTFGDITDPVFKVRPTAAPWHVLQVETLIRAQHDDLDGARLEQSDLVLSRQLPERQQSFAERKYWPFKLIIILLKSASSWLMLVF